MVTKKLLNQFFRAFFIVCFFICPAVVKSQPKYNVLFIAVDDMNDRLNFLGSPVSTTPNLQRLLAHGMNFTQTYDQYPLCSPSRTSLLLGWRPDKTKIYNDKQRPRDSIGPDPQFLPEYFRNNGYHTERYGKILHGTFENDCKWDYAEPPERNEGSLLPNHSNSSDLTKALAPDGSWWIDNTADSIFSDGVEARNLVARMKQPVSQPFFYAYGAHFPHNPFTPSVKYWNMNGDPSVQQFLPIDQNGTYSDLKGNGSGNYILPNTPLNDRADVPVLAFNGHPILIKTNDDWKNTIHAYDGEVQQVDAQIGLMLDEMDRQNLWSNTIVVFWSDHGQHLGEHEGLWKKETLFNESLHVPLIVCVPGKPGGTTCSKMVEYVDIYPTLAELCGLPAPQGMEGSSFARLLDNPTQTWKRAVFSQLRRNQGALVCRAVYTDQYHYNFWDAGQEELYDRIADPHEYTNLVTNPAYLTALNNMRTILADGWTKSLPPACTTMKTFYRDADGDGYGGKTDSVSACDAPSGYVTSKTDCNDGNPNINPGATEICGNGIDDNCNGQIDENNPKAKITPLGNTDICLAGSVALRANNGTGYTFQWFKNGVSIAGAMQRKYVATAAGNYKVTVTSQQGCTATSKEGVVTNSCGLTISSGEISSAQSANAGTQLSVYPNPSTGKVTARFNSGISGNVKLNVYDLSGRLLMTKTEQVLKGANAFALNLSTLASGIYYVELQNGGRQNRIKFIIGK